MSLVASLIMSGIGSAVGITGRIVNNSRTQKAIREAQEKGLVELREGQYVAGQNADDQLQDTKAAIALSGVAMDEGTAAQVEKQNRIQKTVTANQMTKDFNDWNDQMESEKTASNWNLALGMTGDAFSFMGDALYSGAQNEKGLQDQSKWDDFLGALSSRVPGQVE